MTGWTFIYALECEGFVKIGVTTNPRNRLAVAQTMSPFNVSLIGSYEGDDKDERSLHSEFAEYHHKGEWFRKEGRIAQWCDALARQRNAKRPIDHLRDFLKAERGRLTSLAASIGVTPGTISQWDKVPAERVLAVERHTGLPRQIICPELFARPDLVNAGNGAEA